METIIFYLVLSGALTVLLWTPYILARLFTWGLADFLHNYPEGFPATQATPPLWAQRAQRAHLNMVETLPAFVAVVVGALFALDGDATALAAVAGWVQFFFWARVAHAGVYILGIPYLRTPVYLGSWLAVLVVALQALSAL